VDQISLPYRIGLVALLVVAGLWFAVLRPKPATETPVTTTAPGATGLGNAVDKANGAVDASKAAAEATEAAANAGSPSTTAPGAATATKPADAASPNGSTLADDAVAGDPSRSVLSAVDSGKVAVVLFWNDKASDDRATRRALRAVNRHDGQVVTRAIPIRQVGRYEAITRGAQVLESPTVLVIGAGGKARAITGYTQAKEIDEIVGIVGGKGYEAKKAFRLTGFAKVADDACRDFAYNFDQATDLPTSRAALVNYFGTSAGEMRTLRTRLSGTPAKGATHRALKSTMLTFSDRFVALAGTATTQLKSDANPAQVVQTFVTGAGAAEKPQVAAAKKARARGCQ
jgi:hypothetical protein